MRALLMIAIALSPAWAQDADDYDPLLDGGSPKPMGKRLEAVDHRAPGFNISAHAGIYTGATSSYLDPRNSLLLSETSWNIGTGFGYRTPSLIELGIDFDLGFGQTWDKDHKIHVFAFDMFIQPRVFAHIYETADFSTYGGVAADVILFDVELKGMNQAGVGPTALLGGLVRLDDHSLIYLEASATYFYDFLAYHYEQPTEADLMEDPFATEEKVFGDWFRIFRFTVGYRLVRF